MNRYPKLFLIALAFVAAGVRAEDLEKKLKDQTDLFTKLHESPARPITREDIRKKLEPSFATIDQWTIHDLLYKLLGDVEIPSNVPVPKILKDTLRSKSTPEIQALSLVLKSKLPDVYSRMALSMDKLQNSIPTPGSTLKGLFDPGKGPSDSDIEEKNLELVGFYLATIQSQFQNTYRELLSFKTRGR